MLKKKLLRISIITVILLAIFQYLAMKFNLYWTSGWIDIPMHIIGGFWIAITALWMSLLVNHIDAINGYRKKSFIVMILAVIAVAILWELFELIFKITSISQPNYFLDTLSDISNGIVGGLFAFFYFIASKKSKNYRIVKSESNLVMPMSSK